MIRYSINILGIFMVFILTSCGGGGNTTTSNNTATQQASVVQLAGVVVVPNLGVVQNATVTITDLVTNKVLGSSNVQKANGSYTVQTKKTINPVIVSVKGGQYLDESTGSNKAIPLAGITACLPTLPTLTVAVTPITEIATQAALKAGTVTAAIIDAANKNVGSALLGGADPTTTIPVDISKATPATATQAEKNYARLLAGLADSAKNAGVDLYTAAKNLSNALFDPSGAPVLSTGALPAEVTNLQVAVKNYTAKGTILTNNIPASDPYVAIGAVNPALATGSTVLSYYHMQVSMDSYTVAKGQISDVNLGIESFTADLATGIGKAKEFAYFFNGTAGRTGSGTPKTTMNPYGQLVVNGAMTVTFSKNGQFGLGEDIATAQAATLNLFVKKPTVSPTLASVAGTYHIVLMAHNSSATPAASAGYTEHGTLVLDGTGKSTYTAKNTDYTTGMAVTTPVNGVSTYTVDPYGVVLNTSGNGRILLSENGQYGLYELHGANIQEWGIVIKDHTVTVPFSKLTTAKVYDTHYQGGVGVVGGFYNALNVANFAPVTGSLTNMTTDVRKAFAPVQFSPNIICGTKTTLACFKSGLNGDKVYIPANPNDGANAVKGNFFLNPNGPTNPLKLPAYASQNGDVFWVDDVGWAIVIGLGR